MDHRKGSEKDAYAVEQLEMVESGAQTPELGFDEKRTKKLIRKVDIVLLPFLALLYLLSFLDRTNIGNARLAGLEASLHMNPKSLQYNVSSTLNLEFQSWLVGSLQSVKTALAIFFPFYVAAEIPSNMMMKRSRYV